MISQHSNSPDRDAVTSRYTDFWLLGGISIALWLVMMIAQVFRGRSEVIETHFAQVAAVVAVMSLFCNYPHFLISYRFGYGRGSKFIFRHWISLILVPAGMIAFYALAYVKFDSQISELGWIIALNHFFEGLGLEFRLGTLANLGTEILSLSVLVMYMTVGWHYSKQVFGCADKAPLPKLRQ